MLVMRTALGPPQRLVVVYCDVMPQHSLRVPDVHAEGRAPEEAVGLLLT